MFNQIMIEKNGVEIKKMASRKKALLQTKRGKLEENNEDIKNNTSLNPESVKDLVEANVESIRIIDASIILCEVIVEHIPDISAFQLSIIEINFFMNQAEIRYK